MTSSANVQRDELLEFLEQSVKEGVTPGLAAKVMAFPPPSSNANVSAPSPSLTFFVGRTSNAELGRPVSAHTHYDLASLTKIFSTTLLAAYAISIGKLARYESPWSQWPGVSVEHVLQHQSGLPAWKPFYEAVLQTPVASTPDGKLAVLQAVLGTECEAKPSAQTTYSDLGFIALGALLEERLGMPLDDAFNAISRSFYGPTSMRYVPLWRDGFHPNYCDCAPTEACPWRKRVVQGQVHDDNAFVMGGVAGHAGLFGTLDDVSQASHQLLRRVMRPTTDLDRALSSFVQAEGLRGLGFDRPTPGGTTGNALSSSAFGHLGFTGTSVWMDPQSTGPGGAVFILLTNRVHPSRNREGIRALRIGFHEKARRWLDASLRGV